MTDGPDLEREGPDCPKGQLRASEGLTSAFESAVPDLLSFAAQDPGD